MTATRDPANPNAAHFSRPYFMPRPSMRPKTQSERIRASQARLAAKPADVTLPELPEALRERGRDE